MSTSSFCALTTASAAYELQLQSKVSVKCLSRWLYIIHSLQLINAEIDFSLQRFSSGWKISTSKSKALVLWWKKLLFPFIIELWWRDLHPQQHLQYSHKLWWKQDKTRNASISMVLFSVNQNKTIPFHEGKLTELLQLQLHAPEKAVITAVRRDQIVHFHLKSIF